MATLNPHLGRIDTIKWQLSTLWENPEKGRDWDLYSPDGRRRWRVWGGGGFNRTYTTREIECFLEGLARNRR